MSKDKVEKLIFLIKANKSKKEVRTILSTLDKDEIKFAIEEMNSQAINIYRIVEFIMELDEELKKAIIEREIVVPNLEDYHITSLLLTMSREYMIKAIEGKVPGVNLKNDKKIDFLKKAGQECMKLALEGKVSGVEIGIVTKLDWLKTFDDEYKEKVIAAEIDGVEIERDHKVSLLYSFSKENRDRILRDGIKGIELTPREKSNIIRLMGAEYVKEAVEGRIDLPSEEIVYLVLDLEDREYIKKCATNSELKLDEEDRKTLKNVVAVFSINETKVEPNINFNLPENMTIGVEMECEGEMSNNIKNFFEFGDWRAKIDRSLDRGVEVVSPILTPTKKCAEEIYKVAGILNSVGQTVSERCGGHIHIGANYLTTKQSYANFMEIWGNMEQILYAVSNESGEIPRPGAVKYAKPVTYHFQECIENGSVQLTDEKELDVFIEELKTMQKTITTEKEGRYTSLNLLNVNNSGKNTVEFRLANGTINPNLWMDNINLFGGIVGLAEELAVNKENGKQEIFSKLKEQIGDEEKLKILLGLIGVEPTRYVERYRTNIELMKDTDLQSELSKVTGPTKITPEEIRDMTLEVSALSQQEAMGVILNEIERNERENTNDRTK